MTKPKLQSAYVSLPCAVCGVKVDTFKRGPRLKYCFTCRKGMDIVWEKKKKISIENRFNVFKKNATERGKEFTITFEQYKEMWLGSDCSYCGGPLPKKGSGIDRKHNEIGYVLGNCITCCWPCNDRKGKLEACGFPYERILELLRELNAPQEN